MANNELSELRDIAFNALNLDPNNPRIAPRPAPGYADRDRLFDPQVQQALTNEVFEAYKADDLEKTITSLGWAPVDPIIVWQHPDDPSRVVVVEGNTRTSILRRARKRLEVAKEKLQRVKESGRRSMVPEVEAEVAQLQRLVDDTETIRVQYVLADSAEELKEKLPRLLGVRHVSGARNWTPYATNVYISDLYEDMFTEAHPGEELKLVDALIKQAAQIFSLTPEKARKRIQASSLFDHFKLNYSDRVDAAGNELLPEDQYYFDQILQSAHAKKQFEVDKDTLELPEKASEAIFEWAFSKPRKTPNVNVFRKAEDIRAWQSLSKYDADNQTSFANQLDVEQPNEAPTLRTLQNRKSNHEEQMSPLNTLAGLVEAFEKLPAVNLVTQGEMLEPLLTQVRESAERFLAMIHGTGE